MFIAWIRRSWATISRAEEFLPDFYFGLSGSNNHSIYELVFCILATRDDQLRLAEYELLGRFRHQLDAQSPLDTVSTAPADRIECSETAFLIVRATSEVLSSTDALCSISPHFSILP